jgi:hypothetical protein
MLGLPGFSDNSERGQRGLAGLPGLPGVIMEENRVKRQTKMMKPLRERKTFPETWLWKGIEIKRCL